ncbi:MAG TPA: hypothetical protein VK524_23895 [Polyangiaceae bacterium]|nr:hypothetical protein [Polyangiaceae bacterium]
MSRTSASSAIRLLPYGVVLGSACVASAAPTERDAPARVVLELEVPEGCPGEREIATELERLLAGSQTPAEPLAVRLRIRRNGTRHRLSLETRIDGKPLRRELEAKSCQDLTKPAALVLALAIDPETTNRALEEEQPAPAIPNADAERLYRRDTDTPAPQAQQHVRPRPSSARVDPVSDAPIQTDEPRAPSRNHALGFSATAAALLDVGALPSASLGPAVALGATWRSWRLELRGFFLPSRRATLEAEPDQGGDIRLAAGDLGVCYLPVRSGLELGGCLGAELGRLMGRGRGVSDPKTGTATWLAAQARVFCGYRLSSTWALVAAPELIRRIGNSGFEIEGLGTVHRPSSFAARFSAGAEIRFR